MIYLIENGRKELVWCFYSDDLDIKVLKYNNVLLDIVNNLNCKVVVIDLDNLKTKVLV